VAREIEHLARLWTATGRPWPALVAPLAHALARRGEGPRVPAHRDLNEEQVLVDPARPGDARRWVDWDQASFAPAGLDLGNLLAHERLRALRRGDDAGALDPPSRVAVLAAYREAGGRARRRVIGAWEAAACLRLAALARDPAVAAAAYRNPEWVPLPAGDASQAEHWARLLERTAERALESAEQGGSHDG
jgi:aminoglycoside phosphotransferase (APT) family kinase protein